MTEGIFVSIDVGGTNIKSALVDGRQVNKLQDRKTPTSQVELSREIIDIIREFSAKGARAVGIGIPGLVDYHQQKILFCPNLQICSGIDFDNIARETGLEIFLANDADLALYGEIDETKNENIAILTIGTGLGGSFSIDRIPPEKFKLSGEFGHIKIEKDGRACGCGATGCLEAYVSATAITKQAQERIDGEIKQAREVFDIAREGNAEALKIIEEVGGILGVAVANIVNILGVEKIILSGQISKSADLFIDKVRKSANENIFAKQCRKLEINASEIIDEGSLIGGARFAEKKLKEKNG